METPHDSQHEEPKLGEPYCAACGYVLAGLTESSKCPECGRALVDVLVRRSFFHQKGKRFRSKARLLGMPAIDIAIGPYGEESRGKARGFLAIGDTARGVVAIGGSARGIVAIGGQAIGVFAMGGMSIGLLTSVGGLSIGGFTFGGFGIGAFARGGGAAGFMADGGMAFGYYARGGGPIGVHTLGPTGPASVKAVDAFDAMSWFFGPWPPTLMSYVGGFAGMIFCVAGLALLLSLVAWIVHNRAAAV